MWATCPHLASIFEKLLEQKTFSLPAARFFRLFPKNTTPFPRNSTKKFDSRKKTCYNKNGCRSMTVAVDFLWKSIAAAIDSHPHHSITIYGLWKKNQEMNGAPTPASSERIGFFYDYSRCKCWQLLSEISVDWYERWICNRKRKLRPNRHWWSSEPQDCGCQKSRGDRKSVV